MANIELKHLIPVTDPTVPLPLDDHFDPAKPLELEIGCGNGRFLATRAARNPDVQYIGIERLLGRVRKLERKAQTRQQGQGCAHKPPNAPDRRQGVG